MYIQCFLLVKVDFSVCCLKKTLSLFPPEKVKKQLLKIRRVNFVCQTLYEPRVCDFRCWLSLVSATSLVCLSGDPWLPATIRSSVPSVRYQAGQHLWYTGVWWHAVILELSCRAKYCRIEYSACLIDWSCCWACWKSPRQSPTSASLPAFLQQHKCGGQVKKQKYPNTKKVQTNADLF